MTKLNLDSYSDRGGYSLVDGYSVIYGTRYIYSLICITLLLYHLNLTFFYLICYFIIIVLANSPTFAFLIFLIFFIIGQYYFPFFSPIRKEGYKKKARFRRN